MRLSPLGGALAAVFILLIPPRSMRYNRNIVDTDAAVSKWTKFSDPTAMHYQRHTGPKQYPSRSDCKADAMRMVHQSEAVGDWATAAAFRAARCEEAKGRSLWRNFCVEQGDCEQHGRWQHAFGTRLLCPGNGREIEGLQPDQGRGAMQYQARQERSCAGRRSRPCTALAVRNA